MAQNPSLEVELRLDISRIQSGLDRIERQTSDLGNSGGRAFSGLSTAAVMFGNIAATAITGAVSKMMELSRNITKAGIEYNALQETSKIAWTTILGSGEAADKMMKTITELAKKTQFDVSSVDQMAKYFTNAEFEGKALTDQLTKIADVAGAFSISADQAKEMARQMSQVHNAGVAYTEDLNILEDKGVPIMKTIAKNLGITTAEAKKMAGEGKITSEIYSTAFDTIAKSVEGSADAQSQTFSGMIATMQDNLDILFGALSKPMFDKLKSSLEQFMPFLEKLTETIQKGGISEGLKMIIPEGIVDKFMQVKGAVDFVKDGIKALVEMVAGSGNIKWFVDTFGLEKAVQIKLAIFDIIEIMKELGSKFVEIGQNIASSVMPVIQSIIDMFMANIPSIMNFFNSIVDGVLNLWGKIQPTILLIKDLILQSITVIMNLWQTHGPAIMNTLTGILNGTLDTVYKIWDAIQPSLEKILKLATDTIGKVKSFWDENGQGILKIVQFVFTTIKTVIDAVMPAIQWIIENVLGVLITIFKTSFDVIMGVISFFVKLFTGDFEGAATKISDTVSILWDGVKKVFSDTLGKLGKWIGEFVMNLIEKFEEMKSKAWDKFKEMVSKVLSSIGEFIVEGLKKLGQFVIDLIVKFEQMKTDGINKIKEMASNILSSIAEFVVNGISKVGEFVVGLWNKWVEIRENAKEKIAEMVLNILTKLTDLASDGLTKMKEVATKLLEGLKNLPSDMLNMGKDLIKGLINGVGEKAGDLIKKVKGAVDDAITAAKNLLGIKSPSRVFMEIGHFTVQGMEKGIENEEKNLQARVEKMAANIQTPFLNPIDMNTNFSDEMLKQEAKASLTMRNEKQPIIVKVIGNDLKESGLVKKIETEIAGNLNNIIGGRVL